MDSNIDDGGSMRRVLITTKMGGCALLQLVDKKKKGHATSFKLPKAVRIQAKS